MLSRRMDPDAKDDFCLVLIDGALDYEGAVHGIDGGRKCRKQSIACRDDLATAVRANGRIDHALSQQSQACQRFLVIRAREPAIVDDAGRQYRSESSFSLRAGHRGVLMPPEAWIITRKRDRHRAIVVAAA